MGFAFLGRISGRDPPFNDDKEAGRSLSSGRALRGRVGLARPTG